jgi:uncharacterized membrane protein (DUF485 family)
MPAHLMTGFPSLTGGAEETDNSSVSGVVIAGYITSSLVSLVPFVVTLVFVIRAFCQFLM